MQSEAPDGAQITRVDVDTLDSPAIKYIELKENIFENQIKTFNNQVANQQMMLGITKEAQFMSKNYEKVKKYCDADLYTFGIKYYALDCLIIAEEYWEITEK
jgi:hypothetical protein